MNKKGKGGDDDEDDDDDDSEGIISNPSEDGSRVMFKNGKGERSGQHVASHDLAGTERFERKR